MILFILLYSVLYNILTIPKLDIIVYMIYILVHVSVYILILYYLGTSFHMTEDIDSTSILRIILMALSIVYIHINFILLYPIEDRIDKIYEKMNIRRDNE